MLVLVTFVVSLLVSEKRASLALVKIDPKCTRLVTISFYCPPVGHLQLYHNGLFTFPNGEICQNVMLPFRIFI